MKKHGTKHKMLQLLAACSYYVSVNGHPNRSTLAQYTKIHYNSMGVYMSWLRRLKLLEMKTDKSKPTFHEFTPTKLGYDLVAGLGDLYVWQDFMWTMVGGVVVTVINYKGTKGPFADLLNEFLRSNGAAPFPDPRDHQGLVKHRPTLFPAPLPGVDRYNAHIKAHHPALEEPKPVTVYPFAQVKPRKLVLTPPPRSEQPRAPTPMALASGQNVLVHNFKPPQADTPKVTMALPDEPVVLESTVRLPTKEMLMGGRAPRKYR